MMDAERIPFPDLRDAAGAEKVLIAAAKMLSAPGAWLPGRYAICASAKGKPLHARHARAARFSAGTAIVRATAALGLTSYAGADAQNVFRFANGALPPVLNGVCRTQPDMIRAFDRALSALRTGKDKHNVA